MFGFQDIFYVACAPEYVPLGREIDPCLGLSLQDYELVRQMSLSKQGAPYSADDDDNVENRCVHSDSDIYKIVLKLLHVAVVTQRF